jgi:uncharacterized protein (DUF4415 family)
MGRTPIAGISGVLGELISHPADPPPQTAASPNPPHVPTRRESDSVHSATTARCQRARLGRPPGHGSGSGIRREKVTLRIDQDLIAQYRDWSWDERCQLGELVERALRAYRARRTR